MNRLNNFEQYTQEQVNAYSSEINAEALWEHIEPELHPRKNRLGFIWFFLGAVLVLLAGQLWYASPNWGKETGKPALSAKANATGPNANANVATVATVLDHEKTVLATEKEIVANTAEKTMPVEKQNITATIKPQNKLPIATKVIPTKGINPTQTQSSIASIQEVKATDNQALNTIALSTENKRLIAALTDMNSLSPALQASLPSLPPFGAKAPVKKALPPPPPPRFFRNLRIGVGGYVGIGSSARKLKLQGTISPEYISARLRSEQNLETLKFGLDLTIATENGFFVRTGASYANIASVFNFDESLTTIDSVNGITEIRINGLTNDTTFVYGPVATSKTVFYNKKTYNYFRLIDIPLTVGYNFTNEAWSFGVEGGVSMNIMAKTEGAFLSTDDTFYDFGADDKDWYKSSAGLRIIAGLNVGYNMDQNWQIYVSPQFQTPTVFSTDKSPVKESYSTIAVQGGVRYFFD